MGKGKIALIVGILSIPGNIIFAILAIIFATEGHEKRIMRFSQPNFFCCCGQPCFSIWLMVTGALGFIGGVLNGINCFLAISRFGPEYKGGFIGFGIFYLYIGIMTGLNAFIFNGYIKAYKQTYNLQGAIGQYSAPIHQAH